ncbi:LpqB family beta-propeller domain-containing protein [Nocardioides pyridinolyticus]
MRRLPLLLVVVLLLAGCASLPHDGPVVETETGELTPSGQGAPFIDPLPPRDGASRPEIVRGFINAMQAWPSQTNTAVKYLTSDAAAAWRPQKSTITYSAPPSPREDGQDVVITLPGANHLDERGAWQGALPARQRIVEFPMVYEDGEWRIDAVPNALMVPESWFADRFRQVSLYFFDPTASILSPEPIFVPRGDQLATTLTESLLMGPGPGLEQVEQSFVPPGLEVAVGVTVSEDGVADVLLTGDPGQLSPNTVDRMMVQLAWTLRQEQRIESVTLSIGGQPVPLPGGVASYPVDSGLQYDPSGFQATPLLFGLSRGRVVSGSAPLLAPVNGPFGEPEYDLRSVGVNLEGTSVAGVTRDGAQVLAASIGEDDAVRTVALGDDFLRPAWDFFDRMWLLDRGPDGTAARVSYVDARTDRRRFVRVPGITGEDVQHLLVSRDGTRLVAVVRGATGDQLLLSRIEHSASGRVIGAVSAERLDVGDEAGLPIDDIAWRTSSTLAVLNPLGPELAEIAPASVDGAPMNPEVAATTVEGDLLGLAGSPVSTEPIYGILRGGLVDLGDPDQRPLAVEPRTRAVVYVG